MPRGFISFFKSMPLWLKEKLFKKNYNKLFKKIDPNFGGEIYFQSIMSHAAVLFIVQNLRKQRY